MFYLFVLRMIDIHFFIYNINNLKHSEKVTFGPSGRMWVNVESFPYYFSKNFHFLEAVA